ncbi:hypothetical protein B0G69_5285 [Paraburkholderia sp. RAU2J]|nr:hypothetical protein B0G69_5285 [Paraburkholderia sp. RAU2J]
MRILTEGQHFDPVFQQCAFMRTTSLILFDAHGKTFRRYYKV